MLPCWEFDRKINRTFRPDSLRWGFIFITLIFAQKQWTRHTFKGAGVQIEVQTENWGVILITVSICLTDVRAVPVFSSRNSWQEDKKSILTKMWLFFSLWIQFAYGTVAKILKRVSLALERGLFSWVFSILLDQLATFKVICANWNLKKGICEADFFSKYLTWFCLSVTVTLTGTIWL